MKSHSSDRDREFAKLRETDERVRRQFLQAELDTCRTTVQMGEFELSSGNVPIAEKEVASAEKAVRTIERFLPGVREEHRAGLRARLQKIESRLDDLKAKLRSRRAASRKTTQP